MKILVVNLVSSQAAPNLMFIKSMKQQLAGSDVSYLFISTEQMEQSGNSASIMAAMKLDPNSCTTVRVRENSITDILDKVDPEIIGYDELHCNITGGTKIMAIAVFTRLRLYVTNRVKLYYCDIGRNVFIDPMTSDEIHNLSASLTLDEYCSGYGLTLKRGHTSRIDEDYTEQFRHRFREFDDNDNYILKQLREGKHREKGVRDISEICGLQYFLDRYGFPNKTDGSLSKSEVGYLTGGWFEEWVYCVIKHTFGLNDDQIAISSVGTTQGGVQNEYDVLFVRNNKVHYIECKSVAEKGLIANTIIKSDSLKKRFGLSVQTYVLIYNTPAKPTDIDRANDNKIKLFSKSDFERMDNEWLNLFELLELN